MTFCMYSRSSVFFVLIREMMVPARFQSVQNRFYTASERAVMNFHSRQMIPKKIARLRISLAVPLANFQIAGIPPISSRIPMIKTSVPILISFPCQKSGSPIRNFFVTDPGICRFYLRDQMLKTT